MRYFIVIFSLIFFAAAQAGQDIDKSLPATKDGKVVIKIISGDVTVESWDKPEIRVVGEIGGDLEHFVFKTKGSETLIEVESEDNNYGHSWSSDSSELTVTVPVNTIVEASGMSTDFKFSNIHGAIRAGSTSGDVDLENVGGSLKIETVSGDISVVDGHGKMKLSSVSGDIQTEGKATHYDVNTVSGDVDAKLGEVELIDFTSVSGDFEVDFMLSDSGQIEARTVSGDLRFNFNNKSLNAHFDLQTGPGGDIENELSDHHAEESFIGSERLSFSSGKGKGSVQIETMSGSIELRN